MTEATAELLGPELFAAFQAKGYATLTPVQTAVLGADRETRDLRISSQTGSGKTIAIGLALAPRLMGPREPLPESKTKSARPRALVITPTRELGRQVEEELTWLFEKLRLKVVAVTGGTSYRDEHRALARNPDVIVATPGRLIDHLEQGAIATDQIAVVVLDEADRMLDMGFSESLETILSKVPPTRRTHLVSATFSPEVRYLADRIQTAPQHLEGTRLGAANVDITHVLYLVDPRERLDALINLLLAHAESRTLVFTKTRAGVAELEAALSEAGFRVAALSGEMAQRERTRALEGFKRGALRILVATDVAARGIDVSDISLVLHMEPPTDADTYTHRSGRTGRAGRKGTSAVLVAPIQLRRAHAILARANVKFRLLPMPTPVTIRQAQDSRLVERLTAAEGELDARTEALAARLVDAAGENMPRLVAHLLAESGLTQGPEPRPVRVILPEPERARRPPPGRGDDRHFDRHDRAPITDLPPATHLSQAAPSFPRPSRPPREMDERGDRGGGDRGGGDRGGGDFAVFQVSWGERHGADPRRLVAILCRRGDISSADLGAIRVGPTSSTVEVRRGLADHFFEHAQKPDPRDPRVRVRPLPSDWDRERESQSMLEAPRNEAPRNEAPRNEAPRNDAPRNEAPRRSEAEQALPPERAARGPRPPPASHRGGSGGGHAPPRKRR